MRFLSAVLLTVSAHAALAQPAPIDANRPGFAATVGTMGVGVWQLETGIDYTRGSGSNRDYSLPAAELRVGVLEGAELYINSINWTKQENSQGTTRGFQDFKIGTKFRTTRGTFDSLIVPVSFQSQILKSF